MGSLSRGLNPVSKANTSQEEFVLKWFKSNPRRSITHAESKRAIEESYFALYGERLEDSDRPIRRLAQEGKLIKERKGVYRYDPDHAEGRINLQDFDGPTKHAIFERDGYRCVVCGLGKDDGIELQIDHRIPREKGGEGSVRNGQTLCGAHNYQKKILSQTSFGRKLFTHWKRDLLADPNGGRERDRLINFCDEVLALYNKHGIDLEVKK
jgi:hypothetical protein